MGGDGGVIASNRRYMRGAGTADHTADAATGNANNKVDPACLEIEAARAMLTCALSGRPLQFDTTNDSDDVATTSSSSKIVTCPYGRLYNKEAVVEALLRRKQHGNEDDHHRMEQISHIRGMKDLKGIRFKIANDKPICPITNKELNGKIACYAIYPGTEGEVNVVSERALTEMKDLLDDFGPIEEKIRLVPPLNLLQEIKEALELKRQEENNNKNSSKKKKKKDKDKKKKRKHSSADGDDGNTDVDPTSKNNDGPPIKKITTTSNSNSNNPSTKSTKNKKNDVLSSLFTKPSTELSEKERKDSLFAR